MELPPSNKPGSIHLSSDERKTLEVEYGIAFEIFKMQNSQAWQTFQVVSTLALAGLAFVAQLKTNASGIVAWPVSVAVGTAMVTILAGWLALANRWWAYAGAELYRMREIESLLGMYLFREGHWLRKPLGTSELARLNDDERVQYEELHKALPRFPNIRWRQQVLASIIVAALILVWVLFMAGSILTLI